MTQLAIKGHPTRGKEVIQLLEMLGGKNIHRIDAIRDYYVYFVMDDKNETISSLKLNQVRPQQFIIYSLEEFLEKFPYKVGDKVWYKHNNKTYFIRRMFWNNDKISYGLSDEVYSEGYSMPNTLIYFVDVEELQPYKEETMGEKEDKPKAPILSNRCDYAEGKCGYVIPDGYEFDYIKEGFQTEIILKPKKPTYPKTCVECEKILRCFSSVYVDGYKAELLEVFQKLLICRDAYWKIAGEQMGLNKPWEPDWEDCKDKFCITIFKNKPIFDDSQYINRVLAFPTEEMRDAFYENFKDLINDFKELL